MDITPEGEWLCKLNQVHSMECSVSAQKRCLQRLLIYDDSIGKKQQVKGARVKKRITLDIRGISQNSAAGKQRDWEVHNLSGPQAAHVGYSLLHHKRPPPTFSGLKQHLLSHAVSEGQEGRASQEARVEVSTQASAF